MGAQNQLILLLLKPPLPLLSPFLPSYFIVLSHPSPSHLMSVYTKPCTSHTRAHNNKHFSILTLEFAVLEHPCTYTQLEATTADLFHSLTHSLTQATGSKHKRLCLCSKLPGTLMRALISLASHAPIITAA